MSHPCRRPGCPAIASVCAMSFGVTVTYCAPGETIAFTASYTYAWVSRLVTKGFLR